MKKSDIISRGFIEIYNLHFDQGVKILRVKILLLITLLFPLMVFSFYINDEILDIWTDYGLEYYSYIDNANVVYKTMYHYSAMGGTVDMYYVPEMSNITIEQDNPPLLRRNSDTELLITFWLHRNGLFYLNEQVLQTYHRIMKNGKKGSAAFRTAFSIIRIDCQNTGDKFFLSLTEQQ